MKKLFTLLGVVLMASSAFGQTKWTDVTVNGDMESGQNECYQVHEWLDPMTDRIDGNARIVEDPADPTNHVAVLYVRTRAEGEAAGNLTPDYTGAAGTYATWDCQFFIKATEPIAAGKEVRLVMKVKGAKAGYFESQNHSAPGSYIDGNAFGNISFGTDWTIIRTDAITVTESQANSGYQSIAFNVSTTNDGNTLYFDDIKLQVKDPKQQDETSEWINFMRRGIYSEDHITGIDPTNGQAWECSNFTIQTPEQTKAPVVEVPGEPGVFAVKVPVRGYYIKDVQETDPETGEPLYDSETGEPKMKSVYYWNDDTEIGTSAPARWTCQFFVSTLHKMKGGERYRFKFQAKADKPSNLATQAHYGPGRYKDYNTFGSEEDYPLTTEWTTFTLGDGQGKWPTIPSGANGCQTITFDCVPLEGDDNTFYFIFEECSFTEENVTDADRTLGTAEYLVIPIDGEEATYKLDASAMLKTYDAEDFNFLKEGDGMKLLAQKEDEEEEGHMIDTYGSMLSLGDDGFIGADGYFLGLNDDNGIALTFKPETFDGNKINLEIWNNPDANITIGEGNVVNTKLVISQSGWYYLYNITLMSSADKNVYDQAVKDVEEKIDAIDEVVTLDSKAGIETARTAYDALPEYGQNNVSNYDKLTAAEAEYKRLADIKDCIDKIDAIGTVVYTDACKALIDAARSAYDALSDASKEAITNYQTLLDAEAKYAELKDLATGIINVSAASAKNGIMYDLMGRQITKAAKGLYILNGKKYFQK